MLRGVLAIALLVASSHAVADPTAADKLVEKATELDKQGKFREAAAMFARAAKEDPSRSGLFCNIGISFYKADDLARAHLVLGRCLQEQSALEADFVVKLKAALESVETSLRAAGHTPVEVTVTPPGASVRIVEFELDEAFVGRRVVWLPFGRFHLTVHAEGYREQTVEVVTATQAPKAIKIDLARDTGGPIETPKKPPPLPDRTPSKRPAIIATIGTIGSFAIAGLAYSKAHASADRAALALDNDTHAQDKSSTDRWNTTLGLTATLGVAGTVVSGYLWYRALKKPPVMVSLRPGGATIALFGRF